MSGQTIEQYIEEERLQKMKKKKVAKETDKLCKNAKLIDTLDRDFKILKSYPPMDHPTKMDFWCDKDPRKYDKFRNLMTKYHKSYEVSVSGEHDYYIVIDDHKRHTLLGDD